MANKKDLTLREKNLKELLSCEKKVKKFKETLIQDISENEVNRDYIIETMNVLIQGFSLLYTSVESFVYKDDEDELDKYE
jgi:hypothetical protein